MLNLVVIMTSKSICKLSHAATCTHPCSFYFVTTFFCTIEHFKQSLARSATRFDFTWHLTASHENKTLVSWYRHLKFENTYLANVDHA